MRFLETEWPGKASTARWHLSSDLKDKERSHQRQEWTQWTQECLMASGSKGLRMSEKLRTAVGYGEIST